MKKHNYRLSLAVPMYNEGQNIAKRHKELTKWLKKNVEWYELIFVNDGSSDNTLEILEKSIKSDKNAKVVTYEKNKGRGGAVKTGYKKAKGNLVGYIDSDLEIKPKYIGECLAKLKNYDGVVVSKNMPGSKVKTTLLRRTASKTFNYWIRLVLGSKVSDHQAGLKIFKKEVVKKVLSKVKDNGWLFDVEFLFYAQNMGFTIGQVPITVTYGFGTVKKSMVSGYLAALLFVLKLRSKKI